MNASRVRAHVHIRGRVQGVFYRASTRDEAIKIGLAGWVRNMPDGCVEAVFEGTPEQVEQMLNWCHHGPPQARVEHVELVWETPEIEETLFQIRG